MDNPVTESEDLLSTIGIYLSCVSLAHSRGLRAIVQHRTRSGHREQAWRRSGPTDAQSLAESPNVDTPLSNLQGCFQLVRSGLKYGSEVTAAY